MHERTQSIRQQSDQYVDESELPFTPPASPAGDGEPFAAAPFRDGQRRTVRVDATSELRDDIGTAAG